MTEDVKNRNLRLCNEESNRFTCECLKTALFRLIGQKDIESISVSELVRESGVSRNSFYRNYGTMEALLKSIREDMLVQVSDLLNSREHYEKRYDWYLDLFRTVIERQNEFRILLRIKLSLDFFADGLDMGRILPVNLSEPTYERLATAGAFLFMLYHWFTTGMKESPEEMAGLCCKILPDEYQ